MIPYMDSSPITTFCLSVYLQQINSAGSRYIADETEEKSSLSANWARGRSSVGELESCTGALPRL